MLFIVDGVCTFVCGCLVTLVCGYLLIPGFAVCWLFWLLVWLFDW